MGLPSPLLIIPVLIYKTRYSGGFMKKCFKCNCLKNLDEFYKHPKMADGHVNKCKECNKKDVKNNRSKKLNYYREYDKMRFQRDEHRKKYNRDWMKSEKGAEFIIAYREKWQDSNPEKKAAHDIVRAAVSSGKLKKPDNCSNCGDYTEKRMLHGHHGDYNKPLAVEWLCIWCHSKHHYPNEYRTRF